MRHAAGVPHSGLMLWSDPRDDTPQQQRRARQLLLRSGVLIAVFAVTILLLVVH